jgi:hypothetical protein
MVSSILRALSAAALVTLAASTAGAQTSQPAGPAAATTPPEAWAALPSGTYDLLIQLPQGPLNATLVVRDSSGAPAATFQPEGDPADPVKIVIKGTDLTFNGTASKGPYEVVLQRRGTDVSGRWTYGGEDGTLSGKAATDSRK